LTLNTSRRTLADVMKESIHPAYYPEAKFICACGHTFTVGSTTPEVRVEICARCHPFYTGQKKLVDARGRVERFTKIEEKAAEVKARRAAQRAAPRKKKSVEVLTEKEWKKQVKLG